MNPQVYGNIRIIESSYLVEDGEPYTVKRDWWERLFSRPWHPFVSTRVVVPKIPYRGAISLDSNTVVMHPATANQLRESLRGLL